MAALPGRFNDGRTAASLAVAVHVKPSGLEIRGGDGLLVAFWRRDDLIVEGRLPGGRGMRLRCTGDSGLLSLEDAASVAPLLPEAPRRAMPWRTIAVSAAALAILGLGLWKGVPAGARLLADVVPPALEQRWGDHVADSLQGRWQPCRAPAGEAALRLLADRLAAGMPPQARPRRVVVVRTGITNAVALPGGTVMVFDGLLQKLEGGDELAGVLAHEFAHHLHRHPAAAMIRAMGLGVVVMMITGDASGVLATGTAMALGGAYSRDDEAEADRDGVALLHKAGLDAHGMASFFRRLAEEKTMVPEWLSTHPESGSRADGVEAMAAAMPGMPALTPEQWTALKGICR